MTGRDPDVQRTCTVDGRKVRYLEKGSGRPIVLVHGLGLSATVWRDHVHALADHGFRVVAPDLPGFGDSPGWLTGRSVPVTARWLERFAETVGIGAAAWVGHSISCQVLLALAARRPARVSALILAAPTGRGIGLSRVARQFGQLARDAFRERVVLVAGIVRRYFRAPLPTLGTWLRARRDRPEETAGSVRAPVLIVVGEDDPVVREPFAERLGQALSDAAIRRLPGAAHAVALDPYQPFCDAVVKFLKGVEWAGWGSNPRPLD